MSPSPTLAEVQAAFRSGVLGGDTSAARACVDGDGIPADKRIQIYRTNTMVSLIEALAAAFPACAAAIGDRAFRFAADGFVKANPPKAPQLLAYGSDFPDHLARMAQVVRDVPWLPDLARLEWARQEAYFAADAAPLAAEALQAVDPTRLGDVAFILHPATRVVDSGWAVHSLWQAKRQEPPQPADPSAGAEAVLVQRPALMVTQRPITAGDAALVLALATGATLGRAAAVAFHRQPDFDLQQALAQHLLTGTFAGFTGV